MANAVARGVCADILRHVKAHGRDGIPGHILDMAGVVVAEEAMIEVYEQTQDHRFPVQS
jgi:hypothetical protein